MHMAQFFLTFSNIVVVTSLNTASFVMLLSIMNTYFPEPSLVLASMFFHFEPDNDFTVTCIREEESSEARSGTCEKKF
jgi:hypothetical protein